MTHTNDYWARLVRSNPALADEATKMRITVASLRKQIAKAHHAGFKCGMSTAKSLQNLGGSDEVQSFEELLQAMKKNNI